MASHRASHRCRSFVRPVRACGRIGGPSDSVIEERLPVIRHRAGREPVRSGLPAASRCLRRRPRSLQGQRHDHDGNNDAAIKLRASCTRTVLAGSYISVGLTAAWTSCRRPCCALSSAIWKRGRKRAEHAKHYRSLSDFVEASPVDSGNHSIQHQYVISRKTATMKKWRKK
jgi:hypothetical protein